MLDILIGVVLLMTVLMGGAMLIAYRLTYSRATEIRRLREQLAAHQAVLRELKRDAQASRGVPEADLADSKITLFIKEHDQ